MWAHAVNTRLVLMQTQGGCCRLKREPVESSPASISGTCARLPLHCRLAAPACEQVRCTKRIHAANPPASPPAQATASCTWPIMPVARCQPSASAASLLPRPPLPARGQVARGPQHHLCLPCHCSRRVFCCCCCLQVLASTRCTCPPLLSHRCMHPTLLPSRPCVSLPFSSVCHPSDPVLKPLVVPLVLQGWRMT